MLLTDVLKESGIISELKHTKKDDVIKEMANVFFKNGYIEEKESFIDKIKQRENIESTGVGDGIAIPHARCDAVKELRVVFARSTTGVDFKAIDGKPVYLIFMISAPIGVKREYLQVIAKVARLLRNKNYKKKFIEASSTKDIMNIFYAFDDKFPREVQVKLKNGRVVHSKGGK